MKCKKIITKIAVYTVLFNLASYHLNINAKDINAGQVKPIYTTTKTINTAKPTVNTNINSNINQPYVTLVRYGTDWCPHCKNMDKVLKQMEKEYGNKIAVKYINIESPEAKLDVKKYNIHSIPFVLLINDKNQEVGRFSGYKNKKTLTNLLKNKGLLK